MQKEFCDRCGKELHMGGIYRFVMNPSKLRFLTVSHGNWIVDTAHVLCFECRSEFEDWMHDKEIENAEKVRS